jgi:hypothetical protein
VSRSSNCAASVANPRASAMPGSSMVRIFARGISSWLRRAVQDETLVVKRPN